VVDEENRWQDAGEWLAALRGDTSIEKSLPVLSREERPAIPAEPTGKRINPLPWIIAASVVVGLFALAKIGSKPEASIQSGRANTQATDTRAKEAEQRALQLEQEKQTLAEQQADLQRKAHEEEERRALAAQAQAKEETDAKAQAENLSPLGITAGKERDFEIAPGVKITMCWIPPGEFMMGSPAGELGRKNNETQHQVRISKGFWLAKTETTQAQWQAVMGNNPSHFKGQDLPVETVSWDDVAGFDGFIEKVNETATAGGRFALPTEAQWEYACRAGTTGADSGDIEQMAWYSKSSGYTTQPVAGKRSNAWGLHDMRGNVWEWCSDWYGEYTHGPATDPPGATSGSRRVVRGGSWSNIADYCRVTFRFGNNPAYSVNSGFGFRVARSSVP
jgi:formylglycine-generating enzyme required for sulfatase activity